MTLQALALVLLGAGGLIATIPLAPGAPAPWNQEAAARFLDARMDLWWANAKTLKTNGREARCLSCHTALPYAWARSALRRSQGVEEPTPHERRIIEQISQRIAYRADDQPYYDHTEAKKVESRGVEAVVNAIALTGLGDNAIAPERQSLLPAAMARMWDIQRADGAWDWLDFGLEPYEAPDAAFYGATMAAIAAGSPAAQSSNNDASRAGVERLRGYLRSKIPTQRAFNKAWMLLAAARLDGLLTKKERDAIVNDLESLQRADGGWSVADLGVWRWTNQEPPFAAPGEVDRALIAHSDGFATGLVVYALRRSDRATSTQSVRKGQQWLIDHQVPERADDPGWAPWRSHSLNHDREHGGPKGEPWRRMFMSDLATAFGVLALL